VQAGSYECISSQWVCLPLRLILTASAKYDADFTDQNDMNGKLKNAIEEKIQSSLTRSQDGTWSGDSLEYGIQMDRLCLTPENAFFSRLLPRTPFERVVDYIKYIILDPVLVRVDQFSRS